MFLDDNPWDTRRSVGRASPELRIKKMQNAGYTTAVIEEPRSPEELLACARLLALSAAEQRARFGVIPLATYAAQIDQLMQHPESCNLPGNASAAFAEAMKLVQRRTPLQEALRTQRSSRQRAR